MLVLASFDTHLFWQALSSGPYWRGALTALELSAASLAAAVVLGFFVALGALSRLRGVRSASWVYNWLFRATPTLLQLFFFWYALPQIWTGFAGSDAFGIYFRKGDPVGKQINDGVRVLRVKGTLKTLAAKYKIPVADVK